MKAYILILIACLLSVQASASIEFCDMCISIIEDSGEEPILTESLIVDKQSTTDENTLKPPHCFQ